MKCPKCSHDNRSTARFCESCGYPLDGVLEKQRENYQKQCIWYYNMHSVIKGPFTTKEMQILKAAGLIHASTLVFKEGMKEWNSYQDLFQVSKKERSDLRKEDDWYIYSQKATSGPYSEKKLIELIRSQKLSGFDLIKNSGMEAFEEIQKTDFKQYLTKNHAKDIPMDDIWYYSKNKESVRTDKTNMIRMIQTKQLQADSPVWNPKMSGWKAVKDTVLSNYIPLEVFSYSKGAKKDWYYASGQKSKGPVSQSELSQRIASGDIKEKDDIWKTGWKDWQPVYKTQMLMYLKDLAEGWYILEQDKASGPFSSEDVLDWIEQQILHPQAQFYTKGKDGWMSMSQARSLLMSQTVQETDFQKWRQKIKEKNAQPKEDKIWFLAVNNKAEGPYTASSLQTMYANGSIDDSMLVWKQGMEEWVEYYKSELFKAKITEEEWFYVKNQKSIGPFNYKQMQKLYYDGVIENTTWVWKQGMKDWVSYQDSQLGY